MPPPPRARPPCVVCRHEAPKYACATCRANYCTVACYKQHRELDVFIWFCSHQRGPGHGCERAPSWSPSQFRHRVQRPRASPRPDPAPPSDLLKWPYVPDTSAYPDPLTRDDPKPLQLHQYEAIATSPTIRTLLTSHPRLRTLLTSIDALRGPDRERALRRALGVDNEDSRSSHLENKNANATPPDVDTDTRAFRELAEAIERAVRGGREEVFGLDWDQEDQDHRA